MTLVVAAVAWALRDAWRQPNAQLAFAEGIWVLDRAHQPPIAGTLQPFIDLQSYVSVRFTASTPFGPDSNITKQWFHLEAWHIDLAVRHGRWQMIRRAVYAAPADARDEGSRQTHAA